VIRATDTKITAAYTAATIAAQEAVGVAAQATGAYGSATQSVNVLKSAGAKGAGLAAARSTAATLQSAQKVVQQAALDAQKYKNKLNMIKQKIAGYSRAGVTVEANKARTEVMNLVKRRAAQEWLNWTPPPAVKGMMAVAAAKEKAAMKTPIEDQLANIQATSIQVSRAARQATTDAVNAIKAAQNIKAKYERLTVAALAAKKAEELAKMNRAKIEAARALAAAQAIQRQYQSARL